MKPEIAICNIFDQDATRLVEFAALHGFSGIDWSLDPSLPEREFLALMRILDGFQVRFHCRFNDVDVAFTDQRGDASLSLLMRTVDQVALAGGRHMTVHCGLNNPSGAGIDPNRAIDNLGLLVAHGHRNGVAVALENLTTPLTNDPRVFNQIVAASGAFVTIDIGHAHAVKDLHPQLKIYDEYIVPHRERVLNAHVYHTELEGYGHLPPESLWEMFSRLQALSTAAACDWWVIELMKPPEILRTRDLLQNFLDYRYPSPVKAKPVQQQSMAAA